MDIMHLEEFVALSDTLNFGAVARQRYITTATLSKHISALETELGCNLFVRDTHHVRLTRAGRLFVDDAKIIVNGYRKAKTRLESCDESYDAVCRLGYLKAASANLLARFVESFERANPRICLIPQRMGYLEVITALQLGQIDVALLLDAYPELHETCDFLKLDSCRWEVVSSSSHPFASREYVTLDEVRAEPKLFVPDPYRYPGLHQRQVSLIGEMAEGSRVEPYRDLDTLMLCMQMGKGVALSAGVNRPFYPQVSFVPLHDADLVIDVSLAWQKKTPLEEVALYRDAAADMAG
ncbi:MAG: LysR family transcriptional regulator [Eggerthellaceae bacterium]|nr:LysR family transcriptional regulator [Eggerthellaceae bacterium]